MLTLGIAFVALIGLNAKSQAPDQAAPHEARSNINTDFERERAHLVQDNAELDQTTQALAATESEYKKEHAQMLSIAQMYYRMWRSRSLPAARNMDQWFTQQGRIARLESIVKNDIHRVAALERKKTRLAKQAESIAQSRDQKRLDTELAAIDFPAKEQGTSSIALRTPVPEPKIPMPGTLVVRPALGSSYAHITEAQITLHDDHVELDPELRKPIRGQMSVPMAGSVVATETIDGTGAMLFECHGKESVRAAAAGTVSRVSQQGDTYTVTIVHAGSVTTRYQGLTVSEVAQGDHVSQSARIGTTVPESATEGSCLRFTVVEGQDNARARDWLGN